MSLTPLEQSKWAIEAVGLAKSFGPVTALRDITLHIAQQQCIAVVGQNGAGKSTLIRILSTLIRPSSGHARVAGYDVQQQASDVRRSVGFAAHQPMLYADLSAAENLRFYGRMYAVPALEERIQQLVARVELTARRDDPVRTLSRGMQQRLTIIRSLLHNPPILLFDEPYTGLDHRAAGILNDLLQQLLAEGHTLLLTTHDLHWASQVADEMLILWRGRVVHQASVAGAAPQDLQDMYQRYAGGPQ